MTNAHQFGHYLCVCGLSRKSRRVGIEFGNGKSLHHLRSSTSAPTTTNDFCPGLFVNTEKADSMRNNGCFDASSLVETPMGQMEMSQLQTNDLVLTMNSQTGELQFSPVLMWLDRDEINEELYVSLTTRSGKQIRLTSSHLIYLADEAQPANATQAANLAAANNDLSNKAAASGDLQESNGGNNYYYDFIEGGSGNGALSSEREPANAQRNGGQSVDATGERGPVLQPVAPATNLPDSQADHLADVRSKPFDAFDIYTTYARNAVVGQFLLVQEPVEQLRIFTDPPPPGPRFGGPNRLVFNSKQDDQLGPNSIRNDKYKYKFKFNQQQSRTIKTKVMFDEIVSVNYVPKHGIYAPLTRDGNIVVNSVVASCYALISDHDLAHISMAPVRWLSYLYETMFGLRPETPTYERTVDYINRKQLMETRQQTIDESHGGSQSRPDYNTTNSLNRTRPTERRIHWYPILLYNVARYVLPNHYLY